jgi:hypothetical protein
MDVGFVIRELRLCHLYYKVNLPNVLHTTSVTKLHCDVNGVQVLVVAGVTDAEQTHQIRYLQRFSLLHLNKHQQLGSSDNSCGLYSEDVQFVYLREQSLS